MSLAVVLAAGRSTRLRDGALPKQLMAPTESCVPLLEQAIDFGYRLAERVVVVGTSELFDQAILNFKKARKLDVGFSPRTSVDSARAARWYMVDDEPLFFLDSDAIYEDVVIAPWDPDEWLWAGVAPPNGFSDELSLVENYSDDRIRLRPKAPNVDGLVGAGVYGFRTARTFMKRSATRPESLAAIFRTKPASPIFLKNWVPYGTEQQRTSYEARQLHARSAQHLPSP